jgi:hypothetical protein
MNRLIPLLAAAPLLSGCTLFAVGAAAGAGYVVSQQVSNDAHVAEVTFDVDHVWPSVQETMGFLQEPGSQPVFQDFPRVVDARVNGAKVRVEVEAMDLDRTLVRVKAEKYLANDGTTSAKVLDEILERLGKS